MRQVYKQILMQTQANKLYSAWGMSLAPTNNNCNCKYKYRWKHKQIQICRNTNKYRWRKKTNTQKECADKKVVYARGLSLAPTTDTIHLNFNRASISLKREINLKELLCVFEAIWQDSLHMAQILKMICVEFGFTLWLESTTSGLDPQLEASPLRGDLQCGWNQQRAVLLLQFCSFAVLV